MKKVLIVWLVVVVIVVLLYVIECIIVYVGYLFDVDSGKMFIDQVVLIEVGKVIMVQLWFVDVVKGVCVFDWIVWIVVFGLMDMYMYIFEEVEIVDIVVLLKISLVQQVFIGVMNVCKMLQVGFIIVCDVGVYCGFVDIVLCDVINVGEIFGLCMFVVGVYIIVFGGGGEIIGLFVGIVVLLEFCQGVLKGVDQVCKYVDLIFDYGVDLIKVIVIGVVFVNGIELGKLEFIEVEIYVVVVEVVKCGKFVVVYVYGVEGIKCVICVGVCLIEYGLLIDDEGIVLFKQYGIWLVVDIYDGDYIEEIGICDYWLLEILCKNEDIMLVQCEGFCKVVKVGVYFVFGIDVGVYLYGQNVCQFVYMVCWGMILLQVICLVIIDVVCLFGKEKEFGLIVFGKVVDLVVVGCDLLYDVDCLWQICGVIKVGQLVVLDD